jgi:hypothetical protein
MEFIDQLIDYQHPKILPHEVCYEYNVLSLLTKDVFIELIQNTVSECST